MISKKKFMASVLAISIVAALAVGTTLAYLTSETDEVTNTFTVGDVDITLKEYLLNDDGTLDDSADLVTENDNYFVVPGDTQPKVPVLTVANDSQDCYVFIKIVNGLVIDGDSIVTLNYNEDDWEQVGVTTTDDDGNQVEIWGHKDPVLAGTALASDSDGTGGLFSTVTYADSIDHDSFAALQNPTISLYGYAIQAFGFEDSSLADIWAAGDWS